MSPNGSIQFFILSLKKKKKNISLLMTAVEQGDDASPSSRSYLLIRAPHVQGAGGEKGEDELGPTVIFTYYFYMGSAARGARFF